MRQRNHKNLFLSMNCSPTSRQLNGPGKLLNILKHHLSLCKNVHKAFFTELLRVLQSYICESDNPVAGNNRYLYISLELNNSITSNLVTLKKHTFIILTVSVVRSSSTAQLGPLLQSLTKLQPCVGQGNSLILRLNWGKIHFQVHMAVSRIQFLQLQD